jgi:hypothetical protein
MTLNEIKQFSLRTRTTVHPYKKQSIEASQANQVITRKMYDAILEQNPQLKGDVIIDSKQLMELLHLNNEIIQNSDLLLETIDAITAMFDTLLAKLEIAGIDPNAELFGGGQDQS